MKTLAYMSFVHPFPEYEPTWDPFREGQVNMLDWVPREAAKFANLTNDSNWKTAQCKKIARICTVYTAYSREPAWKAIDDRLQRSYYMSKVDHDWEIRNGRQRTDIEKYSFVSRTIQLLNKLPVNALGTFPSKPSTFRKRVRKVK